MLKAPKIGKEKNYIAQPNIDPGTYPARLVQIITLGLQPQRPFQGKDKAPAHEIMLTYELVDCYMVDEKGNEIEDKPRWVSETLPFYGVEAERAKSAQRYLAFDPTNEHDGDFGALIGMPANVTIVNNQVGDKIYDNIGAVTTMRPKDAAKCPELKNPVKIFDIDVPDMEVFNALPEWIREKIKSNLKFHGSALEKALGGAAPVKKEEPKKEAPAKENPPFDVDEDAPY